MQWSICGKTVRAGEVLLHCVVVEVVHAVVHMRRRGRGCIAAVGRAGCSRWCLPVRVLPMSPGRTVVVVVDGSLRMLDAVREKCERSV